MEAAPVGIPFGLKNGVLIPIEEAANGLSCDCTCPKCNNKLIAKNEGKKNQPHFAHYNERQCMGARETSIHLMAKEIFLKEKRLILPCGTEKKLSSVLVEKRLDGIQPDVIGFSDEEFWIEIAVTNFIGQNKRKKIKELKKKCVEIDLSTHSRIVNLQKLKEAIFNSLNVKWINGGPSNKCLDRSRSTSKEVSEVSVVKFNSKCNEFNVVAGDQCVKCKFHRGTSFDFESDFWYVYCKSNKNKDSINDTLF